VAENRSRRFEGVLNAGRDAGGPQINDVWSAYDLSRDDSACAQSASNDLGRGPRSRLSVSLGMRSRAQLAAENLFLRKQLALYMERRVKPRRADNATRIILVGLSRIFEWRNVQQLDRRPPRPVLNDLTDHLE